MVYFKEKQLHVQVCAGQFLLQETAYNLHSYLHKFLVEWVAIEAAAKGNDAKTEGTVA